MGVKMKNEQFEALMNYIDQAHMDHHNCLAADLGEAKSRRKEKLRKILVDFEPEILKPVKNTEDVLTDERIQGVLDSIWEALTTPALLTPFARLSAVGMFINTLKPLTKADIAQAEEVAEATLRLTSHER